jgi:GT2 family glycosyltransferase
MIPRIHAVVLNYNSHEATLQAVAELQRSRDVIVDVLVVDCASAQTDRGVLERQISRDRLLLLSENRGYAGGMNAGIEFWLQREPETPVLLVTPDARVAEDVARALYDVLDADKRVGTVGPVVVQQEKPRHIVAGGILDARGRLTQSHVIEGAHPYNVDWLDGCCVLLRPEAIRETGGFDEQYFLYYEETDLCRRMQQAHWDVRLVPTIFVSHPKTRTSAAPHFFYYMTRNAYRFRAQHFGVGTLGVALDIARSTMWLTAIAIASTLLPQHWHEARDRWRNCLLQWRGVWAGTRDHLGGRYGARAAT